MRPTDPIQPGHGFHRVSYETYDAHPALRRSLLDSIDDSPRHLQYRRENPTEDSAALTQGRVLHTLILEPELAESRIAVWEGGDRRGNAWKEFEALHAGKDILKPAEYDMARAQRDSFLANPMTKDLLKERLVEATAVWTDEETGIDCKARLDIVAPGLIVDLKTARDISDAALQRAVFDFRYHRQTAWYLDAAIAATGDYFPMSAFHFVFIEKTAPYELRTVVLDAAAVKRGDDENRANLRKYARCVATGVWPGLEPVVKQLSLPRWA